MKLKYWALFRLFPSRMILFQSSVSIVAIWGVNFMIWLSNALWWTNCIKICSVLKNQIPWNQIICTEQRCLGSFPFVLPQLLVWNRSGQQFSANERSIIHVLGDFVSCIQLSFGFLIDGSLQKEIVLKMKNKSDKKILTWRFVHRAPAKPPVVRKFIRCFMFANSVSQVDQWNWEKSRVCFRFDLFENERKIK